MFANSSSLSQVSSSSSASSTLTQKKGAISLQGSVAIVTEFFSYAIQSILYQREIYPQSDFKKVAKYGLPMMISNEKKVSEFISSVLKQVDAWLNKEEVSQLVMAIKGLTSDQVLERWVFDIHAEKPVDGKSVAEKSDKQIVTEIQAIMRQVTASVTFLPLIEEPCKWDILVYTNVSTNVPQDWEEADPQNIANPSVVRLRSFSTSIHKIDTLVSYRTDLS